MYKRKLLVLISLVGSAVGLYFVIQFYQLFFWSNTQFENEVSYVFIDQDDTIDSLAIQLTPFLKRIDYFLLAAEKKGYDLRIRPGKYTLKKGWGNNEMINSLRSQRMTVLVTFNNQERIEDLAGRIAQQIIQDSLTLLETFTDTEFLQKTGFTEENALSMYLPNSYEFYWDTSAENVRDKMLVAYRKFWNPDRMEKANSIQLSPQEVYILASIVEKESVQAEEQTRIDGVYLNRLRKKMKLQADPTVIYSMKKESGDFDQIFKRVLYKDLKLKSPYNTYQFSGLPPGPIWMPTVSAIDAVLNAENHSYLYFVVSPKKPGYHLFAKDMDQHNRNKKIYTRWLDQQRVYR
ncbi:MAG: endolytic transglycosylase MltG [Flavobacteriaceae bacterium]